MTIKISKNNTEELATTLLTCIDMLSRVLDNVVEVDPTPEDVFLDVNGFLHVTSQLTQDSEIWSNV